ncbi:DUF2155 domain-containing protein [Thalassovita taeanensis]|uniref:DUF2155 domain-containing protein n=1 Tax=Thalassovita taeanensis TaxID=657014 RepID=A0A1H9KQM6_9RHOB|nr:DUF2155 domain-containing protein [Thalassovita taeanensis]SER01359.1 hypothetical protein SAMN04488092_12011 [Thalassovita taeanensis]
MKCAAALLLSLLAGTATLAEEVSVGRGAVLRGLDKVNAQTTDIELDTGGRAAFGRLRIELGECRYPQGNPAGDAYAYLMIHEEGVQIPIFQGWMMASSPALNALDDSRYDVWVIRCKTS